MIELWHVGLVRKPIAAFLTPDVLAQGKGDITWLPMPGSYRFLADPFPVATSDGLTLFVEAYDYRTRRGEIHYYTYDHETRLRTHGLALATPFHLSYPQIIRDNDSVYMLPEAHKSGALTLYRAERFPDIWTPVAQLLNQPAIDATVVQHQGRWWMFYALPGAAGRAMRQLHIAYADALTGPWYGHAGNPVREGFESSRPGGNAFLHNGALYLPMQDCVGGYGRGIHILHINQLTPEAFSAERVITLSGMGLLPEYDDGLHTLSGDGDVTAIDVKRMYNSPMNAWIKFEHRIRRLFRSAN